MSTPAITAPPSFATAYEQALIEYALADTGEEALMHAYELGRQAVTEQRSILDLVALHQHVIWQAVVAADTRQRLNGALARSEEFLAEVLAPFEMMHRGFADSIRQLQEVNATLEQRVEERTRSLRESQRKTVDLARLYLILSNINSAIVRLQNRGELFQEACRIAVYQGGYPVAWITLRADQESAGTDSWCHITGTGPVCDTTPVETICTEVRNSLEQIYAEGRPVVCHRTSENLVVWNGSGRGYAAYALLPLLLGGRVIGAFALFSADPKAFDPGEMRLLEEMAGDLSFALDSIHKGDRLNYLAYFDALTGLPNRTLLLDRLHLQIQAASRNGTIVALLLVNLIRFSEVNETYGHRIGDQLLKQVGERLCAAVGSLETVARVGSDRFALTLTNIVDDHQVAHILEQEVLSGFTRPFRLDEIDFHLPIQVGIALFPSDAPDVESLLKNAEIALRGAQSKGEPYLLYNAEMNERVIHSVTMQAKLRKAIERDAFVVHYQPKVATATRSIVGLEALLRYNDPEAGLILPGQFVGLLEENGMVIEVGAFVMQRAAQDLCRWRKLNLNPPPVAVNVSPIQLRQKNFIQSLEKTVLEVRECLGRSGGLDMEITESAIMEEVRENIPKLEAAREMGFRIAIDDFGTGYSSLNYLSQLPVNALKIDRSFIVDMTERPNNLAIVTSIISLAHSLDLEVIAEGVEFEEQAKLLRLLRCELIQGNLFSPPLPPEEIAALLKAN